MHKDRWIGVGLIVALAALVSVGLWKTRGGRGPRREAVDRRIDGLMGTTAMLAAVVAPRHAAEAEPLLREAEQTLRRVEARMSTWLDDSETGRLNAAPAGRHVPLSPEVLGLLRTARQAAVDTGGAFDVTCRPLIELWREAGKTGRLPTDAELAAARAASSWDLIELDAKRLSVKGSDPLDIRGRTPLRIGSKGAVKRSDTARVDLGGIAKGYAIDRALDVLKRDGRLEGGLVDVGGDLACFGQPPSGDRWVVDVQNPFGAGVLLRLRIPGGAVCTSGGYARYVEIAGRRYSHILDPRTGRPADAARSVTVVAPTAVTADVWATALSVLGVEGLARLPEGVEALVVEGAEDAPRVRSTPGFRGLLEQPLSAEGGNSPGICAG